MTSTVLLAPRNLKATKNDDDPALENLWDNAIVLGSDERKIKALAHV